MYCPLKCKYWLHIFTRLMWEIPATYCCWGRMWRIFKTALLKHTQTHAGRFMYMFPAPATLLLVSVFHSFLAQQVKIKVCLWSERTRKNQNYCTGNILRLSIGLAVSAAQGSQMRVNVGQPEKDMRKHPLKISLLLHMLLFLADYSNQKWKDLFLEP